MEYLTWDNIILGLLLLGTLVGFLLRKAEMVVIIVSLALAHFFTEAVGDGLASLLRSMFGQYIPLYYVKIPLFIFSLIILVTEQHLLNNALEFPMGFKNNIEGAIWGVTSSGIFLTSIFMFLEYEQRTTLFSKSYIANVLNANRVFFVIIPIILIMVSSITRRFKIGATKG